MKHAGCALLANSPVHKKSPPRGSVLKKRREGGTPSRPGSRTGETARDTKLKEERERVGDRPSRVADSPNQSLTKGPCGVRSAGIGGHGYDRTTV